MRRHPGWIATTLLGSALGCFHAPSSGLDLVSANKTDDAADAVGELPPFRAAEACLATAQALDKKGHEPEAIAEYEKARQYNPKLTQVSRRLAVLYDRQCDYTRAMNEYKLALQDNPKDADLLNDLGYCCHERGDDPEAEKWLRQALEINPKHARAQGNLALTLGHQGRYKEAFDAFTKVVSPAQAHSNLGVILAQQGQSALAQAALRQALELEPDLKQARFVLSRLEKPTVAPQVRAARPEPDPEPAAPQEQHMLTAKSRPSQ